MHLWNDYEGKILAGLFPLEKLLRTEGRSASFATRDSSGRPAVIRLTEALNDQQQMRARYRAIQFVGQANLVTIADYGEAEFEGTPLIYLVMEPTQESLADIVRERRLSIEETGEVAISVLGALEALHTHELVHGLMELASVLAAGEVIKLRVDCVRPAPEGGEGDRARAEDLLGFADILHQSLTQERLQEASDALRLPEPYASVVRHVIRGTWGLEQVAAEIRRCVRPLSPQGSQAPAAQSPAALGLEVSAPVPATASRAAAGPPPPAAPTRVTPTLAAQSQTPTFAESLIAADRVLDRLATDRLAAASSQAVQSAPLKPAAAVKAGMQARLKRDAQLPLAYAGSSDETSEHGTTVGEAAVADTYTPHDRKRWHKPEEPASGRSPLAQIAIGVGLLLLVLLVWRLTGSSKAAPNAPTAAPIHAPTPAQPVPAVKQPAAPVTKAAPKATAAPEAAASAPAPTAPAPAPTLTAPEASRASNSGAAGRGIWRVVAYTYNAQGQANARARLIAARYPNLHPEVYSPSGAAPYLVTLGGALTRQEAASIRERARGQGLARDMYIQNYSH